MKILALDTTTPYLCLGLSDEKHTYEYAVRFGTKQSVLLVPVIKKALDSVGWDVRDIDYFACGIGPGSFTGIRLAWRP